MLLPASVTAAVRCTVVDCAVSVTVEEPVPFVALTVSQSDGFVAVHEHHAPVVSVTAAVPPAPANVRLVGLTV
jgi:hypothetical protein